MIDRCCVSLSESCNMRCGYCHFATEGRRGVDMTQQEAEAVLGNIRSYLAERGGRFKIGFVGGGEPMLRAPLLLRCMEGALAISGVSVYTISNGLGIPDGVMEFAADNSDRVKLCISLDGPREMHDRYRRDAAGRGTFDRVWSAVKRYEGIAGAMPAVNCTLHREGLAHSEELIGFFKSEGISDVTFSQIFDCPGLEISDGEFRAFLAEAGKRLDTRQSRSSTGLDCRKYGKGCGAGVTNLYFSARGVYPCGRFAGLERYRLGSCYDGLGVLEGRLSMIRNDSARCAYDALAAAGVIE